jgi:hypothetical protein
MRLRLLFCLPPALLVAACGSLPDDPSEPDALATLEGQLTNQSAVPLEGDVRIAVIWRRPSGDGVTFSVAEDVPVEPVFPSKFRVVLRNPPPEEAMVPANDVFEVPSDEPGVPEPFPLPNDGREGAPVAASKGGLRASALRAQENALPPDLRVAMGTLVAYVDDNRNGRLDLVEEGAPGFVDRVVATNDGLLLGYFEGTIPSPFPEFEAPPAPGYNFLVDTCAGGDGSVSSDDPLPTGGPCVGFQASSTGTPFALPVTDAPGLNDLMCKNGGSEGGGSVGGSPPLPDPSVQPERYPSPGDPTLQCAGDGSSYTLFVCETYSEGLCKGVTTTCNTTEGYRRPDPVPAGWPCPSP